MALVAAWRRTAPRGASLHERRCASTTTCLPAPTAAPPRPPSPPQISKSQYFDENIPESATAGPTEMIIKDFPGGPGAFEMVAKYCYGIDIELTVDNIAYVYCASRVLRVSELEKLTEAFMTEVVLRDPAKSAVVLKVATGIGAWRGVEWIELIDRSQRRARLLRHVPRSCPCLPACPLAGRPPSPRHSSSSPSSSPPPLLNR